MYTVRKLRNLAKMKHVFNQLTEKFMLSACLLLKKGLLYNTQAISSLKHGQNVFQLQGFSDFNQTTDNDRIMANFSDDNKIYQTFHSQMIQKFKKEVNNPQYKEQFHSIQEVTLTTIDPLDKLMLEQFKFLLRFLPKINLTEKIEAQAHLAILHFYYSIKTEETFPFVQNQ